MAQIVSVAQVVRRFGLRVGAAALVLALVAVSLTHPGTAFAANFSPGEVLQVDTPSLNVRSAPGTGSGVVTVLSGGTKVTIVEGPVAKNGYNWYKIASPSGWLIGEGLAPVGNGNPGGNPGGNPSGSGYAPGTNVVVSTDALNLRSKASLTGSVLTVLPNGTAAVVVSGTLSGDGYSWYEIKAWGQTGFAVADFLSPAGSDGNGGGGGGSQVPPSSKATVATNALNVRATAGTGAAVVTVLPWGTSVSVHSGPVSSGGYSWYEISSAAGSGWAAGEFLSFGGNGGGNSGGIGPGSTVVVSDGPVNLRKSSGIGGHLITTIPTGTKLSVSDGPVAAQGYTWVYVTTPSSVSGWVAAEFLSAV
jgi:uncharacterized protein YgiM (DUF1202 family)